MPRPARRGGGAGPGTRSPSTRRRRARSGSTRSPTPFAEGRHLCIHEHRVARAGAWHDLHACWFPALYTVDRAGHAIEMTAARLHEHVERVLGRLARRGSAVQRERLAA